MCHPNFTTLRSTNIFGAKIEIEFSRQKNNQHFLVIFKHCDKFLETLEFDLLGKIDSSINSSKLESSFYTAGKNSAKCVMEA